MKAACSGWSPSPAARPSTVVISLPSCITASARQELIRSPSIEDGAGAALAVVAAFLGAGEVRLMRSRSSRVVQGRTFNCFSAPLTRRVTGTGGGADVRVAEGSVDKVVIAPAGIIARHCGRQRPIPRPPIFLNRDRHFPPGAAGPPPGTVPGTDAGTADPGTADPGPVGRRSRNGRRRDAVARFDVRATACRGRRPKQAIEVMIVVGFYRALAGVIRSVGLDYDPHAAAARV